MGKSRQKGSLGAAHLAERSVLDSTLLATLGADKETYYSALIEEAKYENVYLTSLI